MKLFVLLSRLPYPLEKGDKLRAYYQLKVLNQRHEIHLCCLAFSHPQPAHIEKVKEVCSHLTVVRLHYLLLPFSLLWMGFGRKPFQVGYFFQLPALRKIQRLIRDMRPDHIYAQLVRTAEYVKDFHSIPKTLDYQDAFSAGYERREERSGPLMRLFISSEKRRLRHYENLIFEYFDHKTIISEQDRKDIRHPERNTITVVPNGVDRTVFFHRPLPKNKDLLFTGNMNYPPNVETVQYLVREVMPLVWKERPETGLTICGATPHPKVQELAGDRVTVTGWVDDINAVYNSAKLMVAPMQIGAGLQNKLLEAMACRLPCITSPLANSALKAKTGVEIIVCSTALEYATEVLELLSDQKKREALAENAERFVEAQYSWEHSVEILEKCFLN